MSKNRQGENAHSFTKVYIYSALHMANLPTVYSTYIHAMAPKSTATTTATAAGGVTKPLSHWIHSISLDDIPSAVRTRAKYLILDGLGCAIVGAHLPWTETAVRAIFDFEPEGNCWVWGWEGVSLST